MKKVSIVNWGNKYISGGGESAANAIKAHFESIGTEVDLYYCDSEKSKGLLSPGKVPIRMPFYYWSTTADSSWSKRQRKRLLKWGSLFIFELVVCAHLLAKKRHNIILGEAFIVGFMLSLFSNHKVILRLHGPIKSKIQRSLVRKNITLVANGLSYGQCKLQFPSNEILDLDPPLPEYFGITRLNRAKGSENDPVTTAYVGRFEEVKGFDLLVSYIKILSKSINISKVVLVGEGELSTLMPDLLSYCADVGVEVEVLGPLKRHQVAKLLSERIDLLLLPSRADNSPNVIREAIASGVPVAVSKGVHVSNNIDRDFIYFLDKFEMERFEASFNNYKEDYHEKTAVGDAWLEVLR